MSLYDLLAQMNKAVKPPPPPPKRSETLQITPQGQAVIDVVNAHIGETWATSDIVAASGQKLSMVQKSMQRLEFNGCVKSYLSTTRQGKVRFWTFSKAVNTQFLRPRPKKPSPDLGGYAARLD